MWQTAPVVLLLVAFAGAIPQGYNYQIPTNPLPSYGLPVKDTTRCDDVTSVVYSTAVRNDVRPTTIRNYDTRYRTTTIYSQQVVPTTVYRTQIQTSVLVQTSYVQRQTEVVRQEIVTRTQPAKPVFRTQIVTQTRVVPQVSYITREVVKTQVVPVERTNTRYETRYQDRVQYQTVPVERTSVVQVPGKDVVKTVQSTIVRNSVVDRRERDQTRYQTTTKVEDRIDTQTVPSPPVQKTQIVQSQVVVPTVVVSTRNQVKYDTKSNYITSTRIQIRTEYRTQQVPQEVVVTRDVPREVLRTEYQTVVSTVQRLQTQYNTRYNTPAPVLRTQQEYETSYVRVPGQDRVVTRHVASTEYDNQVVQRTQNVHRQVVVTRTVTQSCEQKQSGYNYRAPSNPFRF